MNRALFGAFRDSAPDRWGRTLIKRTEMARAKLAGTAPHSMSEVEFLLGARDDLRQGALRFRRDDEGPYLATEDSGVPALADLPRLLDIADRAESDTAGYEDLKHLLRRRLAGWCLRPKAHVIDSNGRIAIAKFPNANSGHMECDGMGESGTLT